MNLWHTVSETLTGRQFYSIRNRGENFSPLGKPGQKVCMRLSPRLEVGGKFAMNMLGVSWQWWRPISWLPRRHPQMGRFYHRPLLLLFTPQHILPAYLIPISYKLSIQVPRFHENQFSPRIPLEQCLMQCIHHFNESVCIFIFRALLEKGAPNQFICIQFRNLFIHKIGTAWICSAPVHFRGLVRETTISRQQIANYGVYFIQIFHRLNRYSRTQAASDSIFMFSMNQE